MDTSGSWGAGAWHQSFWFQIRWDKRAQGLSIAAKELIPIILAYQAWGECWASHQVTCYCDNQVVVACLWSRTSKDTSLMHLLHCLVFVEARYTCYLYPSYIDTKVNHLADDLSGNNAASFLSKVPQASPTPTPISHHLLDLLLDTTCGRLDLSVLVPVVQFFFDSGLAPSTKKSYQAATKRFYFFCSSHNVLELFSLSEQLL